MLEWGLRSGNPAGSASGMKVGETFNPWRRACGFYPPDLVSRFGPLVVCATRRNFKHSHKQLYTLLVRRWGREGPCFPGQSHLAASLGASERSIRMWVED